MRRAKSDPLDPRREFERELLYGDAVETAQALIDSLGLSQREIAARLKLSEARVSRILSGRENATLKTVADLGWALGVRFSLVAVPFEDRSGTPAAKDGPIPGWLARHRRLLAGQQRADGPRGESERD